MNILITGGAGFIGSHFTDLILTRQEFNDSKIYVVDKLTYAGDLKNLEFAIMDPRVRFHKIDICDNTSLMEIVNDCEWVVNFAAESHVDRSIESSAGFIHSNIQGVDNLLRNCIVSNSKFLQISTDEVYGSIPLNEATEFSNLNPSSVYSASKAAADLIGLSYCKTFGLDVRISRSCNNFGPRQNPEKLIPKVIISALRNEVIPIYGNGLNVREWISVYSNVEALFDVIFKGTKNEIYNIGSQVRLTNLDIVNQIIKLTNSNSEIQLITDRKGHDYRYAVDSSKIKSVSKYLTNFEFENELKSTIDWYASNEKNWNG